MDDLIKRQQAIATADNTDYLGLAIEDVKKVTDEVVKGLKQLPSAQPEIIRCKDCKHWMNEHLCKKLSAYYGSIDTDADFFCGYAGRRNKK